MAVRIFFLWVGLVAAVQAEVPAPPMCEQLHLVVEPDLRWPQGASVEHWLKRLQTSGELQLHVHEYAEDSAGDFASGVLDLWLGAGLERLQQTAAHPLQPALWQDELLIWLRSGELASLEHWPQLDGLRGGFWSSQYEAGELTALQPHLDLSMLRELRNPVAALDALLEGRVDFLLASRELMDSLLVPPLTASEVEHLAQPLQAVPRYLAISNNSACKDAELLQRLTAALSLTAD